MSAASALSRIGLEQPQRGPSGPASPESIADKVRIGGSATIRVVARSMQPWVRLGDQVFVRRYDFSQIVPGNIILYERANRLFIQRVIRRIHRPNLEGDASFLIVKGESNAPVSVKEFLGRAIRIHRGNRHIDLESFSQTVLGVLLARVSGWSRLVFRTHSDAVVAKSE